MSGMVLSDAEIITAMEDGAKGNSFQPRSTRMGAHPPAWC